MTSTAQTTSPAVPQPLVAAPRARILAAAVRLLTEGGREAVSTRAVMAAANVQAPTIYRQFGDLHGLLVQAAGIGFASYLTSKAAQQASADPVEDLRRGWDGHVAFGMGKPAVYALLYGDPRQGELPDAVQQARAMLRAILQRVAASGRLRVGVDLALEMVDAAGAGVVLHLLATDPTGHDPELSSAVRDAVLSAITTPPETDPRPPVPAGPARTSARAVALKAVLSDVDGVLTPGELHVLGEWLDRLTSRRAEPA